METMETTDNSTKSPFDGKRVAFVGKLGGLNRREAARLIREHGGIPVEQSSATVDCIIVGASNFLSMPKP